MCGFNRLKMAALSPSQELYAQKYSLLAQKFREIQLGNCRLKNHMYHIRLEIRSLKRLKRQLVGRLHDKHGCSFENYSLEIPGDAVKGFFFSHEREFSFLV